MTQRGRGRWKSAGHFIGVLLSSDLAVVVLVRRQERRRKTRLSSYSKLSRDAVPPNPSEYRPLAVEKPRDRVNAIKRI